MKAPAHAALTLLLLLPSAASTQMPKTGTVEVGTIYLRDARILDVDTSHVRLAVDLSVKANDSVVIDKVQLTHLTLNGMPVFAEPVDLAISLLKGRPVALPPLNVTVYFSNLTTLTPLRQAVERQSAHVQGQLVGSPQLGFLARLMLHTEHPRILLPISQDVPVDFADSRMARRAVTSALNAADFALQKSKILKGLFASDGDEWSHVLEGQARHSLLEVIARYGLTDKQSGERYSIALSQLGFRVVTNRIVLTQEAQTPWNFDPDFLSHIQSGNWTLNNQIAELTISSLSDSTSGSYTPTDFTTQKIGELETDKLIVLENGHTRVQVARRASPGCIVALTMRSPPAGAGFVPVPVAVAEKATWDKVAAFSVTRSSTGELGIEVIQMSAKREGAEIVLSRPLQASSFGSPLLTPEGLLGIVQDETRATLLPTQIGFPDQNDR